MFGFDVTWLGWVLFVPLVAYVVGKRLFAVDEAIEDRRRHAIKLSGTLRGYGLSWFPELLDKYAVGDYSGMAQDIQTMVGLFTQSPDVVVKEFDQIFDRVLATKLASKEGRAYLKAVLDDTAKTVGEVT